MTPAMRLILLGGYDADAGFWRDAVRAAGSDVSPFQMGRTSTLITSLKASGVWFNLDRLWLFAAENATQALIDLKARATATAVNSPTFTANRGYKGSHLSAYINSNFNPSTAGGNYTQNGASYGLWVETAESTPSGSYRYMGNDSSNYSEVVAGTSFLSMQINQGAPAAATTIPSASTGLISVSRSGATATARYLNGALDSTTTLASIAMPNNNFNILAGNNAGTAYQQSDARAAAAFMGGNLTALQQAALYAQLRTYMTAVGVA